MIICPIFQNFFLAKIVGKLGESPIPIILIFSTLFIYIYKINKKFYKENKVLIKLLIYMICVNIVSLFIFIIILNGDSIILGENVLSKSIKGMMYFFLICIYIFNINTFIEKLTEKRIFKPFILATNVLLIAHIFELIQPNLFNQLFHNGTEYNRIRLFTTESSFTAIMIFIYPIISIYYYLFKEKAKYKGIIYILIMIFFIANSGSKSIMINIPIAIVILYLSFFIKKILYKERGLNVVKVIVTVSIILIIIVLAMPKINQLISYLNTDINEYTSIITRYYTLLIAFIISVKFPFGIGNSLYLKVFPYYLEKYIYLIDSGRYNLSEIYSFINATHDTMVTAKSGISQYGMYWGIIGNIVFIIYLYRIYINIFKSDIAGKTVLLSLYLIVIIGIINFVAFDIAYEIFALIVLLQYLYRKSIKGK